MQKALLLVIGMFLLTAAFSCSSQRNYSSNEAMSHVGENATVVGKVYQVYESRKGTIFIDIGGRYPDNTFSAVVFASNTSSFSNAE